MAPRNYRCGLQLIIAFALLLAPLCKATPRKLVLLPTPPLVLSYHKGPLLTGTSPLNLYFLWYGAFSPAQQQILFDFASSFSPSPSIPSPSVSSWWATASSYTDLSHSHVSSSISLAAHASVQAPPPSPAAASFSLLRRVDIASVLLHSLQQGQLPLDEGGVYFVFTAADIAVEGMCTSSCGFHEHLQLGTPGRKIVYAWVGNSAKQCPGECAWPFALPEYGPKGAVPLVPPNGDVGLEGMVMNMATLLAGAATNPFGNGYFQGPSTAPLEAVSACTGIFGPNAYPGFPGSLLTNPLSGASLNTHGANGRSFLLPSIWNPSSQTCSPPT